MSDYLEMNLEQLQKEHAELLAFNENLDRERNKYRDNARKYAKKVQMIASLFVMPGNDHELTLKAIKTIVEQVGGRSMTRLEHLSQFSNAVLSPELNTCVIPMPKHGSGWAEIFDHNNSELKADDIAFRKKWCEQQVSLIGEFGAVMEVAS